MTTITKEWLQQTIAEFENTRDDIPFGLDEDDAKILVVLKMALAGMEQEPVAYMYRDNLHTDARFSLVTRFSNWSKEDINEFEIKEIPLYAAPQPLTDAERAELEEARRILAGLPQLAIDGGWTAAGASAHARRLEDELEAVKAQLKAAQAHINELEAAPPAPVGPYEEPVPVMPDFPGRVMTQRECYRAGWEARDALSNPATAQQIDNFVHTLSTELMRRIDKATDGRHSVATLSTLRKSVVEACRTAMLQSRCGIQTAPAMDSLPRNDESRCGNSPVIPDGWVLVPKEPTPAMINAWLSEVANFRGHAAGYRAALAAAPDFLEIVNSSTNNCRENAETSTKCWVACSERMPDETQPVITVSDGGVVQRTVYQFCEGVWIDWYEQHDELNVDAFTHWMPLPAAPHQEVK